MKVIPFEASHLELIDLQDAQMLYSFQVSQDYAKSLINAGPCYSAIVDGKVICSAGLVIHWTGRATFWAFLSKDAGVHMIKLTKAGKRWLDMCGIKRVEAFIDAGFPQGIRWVEMFGFAFEGRMTAFSPDGKDYDLYARIN